MKTNIKRKLKLSPPTIIILCWSAIMILCPMIYIFVLSFLTRGPSGNVVFAFTLHNYSRIFGSTYIGIFTLSIMIAFLTTLVTLIIGYPMGYLIARVNKRYQIFLLLLVMVPFWTSSLLRTNGWIILLQGRGIINTILMTLGIIKEPLTLMYNYGAVLMGTVYMLLPFMILPIYNSVEKLDKSVLEASYDLGAGRLQTFLRVTLPLTIPGIIGGATLVFIPSVGMFFISDFLGDSKSMLLGNLIQNQFQYTRNWPFGAALSVIMIVGVLLFVLLTKKVSGDGEGGLF